MWWSTISFYFHQIANKQEELKNAKKRSKYVQENIMYVVE